MFDPSAFDLDAYFRRIGFTGQARPTVETLAAVASLHPAAIPFENIDPYLGRPVALDIDTLQRKLLHGGRGGWCFEHNLLLGTALAAIGFRPAGLGARVLWNAAAGPPGPRSHMVLLVDAGPTRFIVDAGFGGLTLTGPLRLEPDREQATPHERFRMRTVEDDLVMEAELHGEWRALYRFDLSAQRLADYEVSNWYLCHHPQSHFRRGIVAARALPGRRYALRGSQLTTHRTHGPSEHRQLASATELRQVLEDTFGIAVPAGSDVDTALDRLIPAAASQAG